MNLNNAQLINYKDRIKLSREDKQKYQTQIDYLVRSLESKIAEHIDTRVLRVIQSGSWKKETILKEIDGVPIDIDLLFFLDVEPEDSHILHTANDLMLPILKSIYPNKSDSDFWDNPKTAGLEFTESGLNVDVVPVGKTRNIEYVTQPDKNSTLYITSPERQLQFISDIKTANTNYTTIVRLLKKWRNFNKIELSSFVIELIVAYLDINKGIQTDIQESILRFFKLVGKKQFPVLLFNAPFGTYQDTGSHVYIADPTFEENNIVHNVTDLEWNLVRIKANTAFETLILAEGEEFMTQTLELWKEVFGTDFNIEPIEN